MVGAAGETKCQGRILQLLIGSADVFKTWHRTGDRALPPVAVNAFSADLSIGS